MEQVQVINRNKFEHNLEALRAFAAFTVILNHIVAYCSVLLAGYHLRGIFRQNYPGHLCVLIFFILSGYVIGLTTRNKLEWSTVGTYIKKRLFRLYPIYVLAILLALLITQHHYSLTTVLANLFFLQRKGGLGFLEELLTSWSLHYEVLFYILFIPLSVYAVKPVWAFWASIVVGIFFQVVVPVESLSMYGFGFSFWVAGLYLSRAQFPRFTPSRATLLGLLFLVLCATQLNFIVWLLTSKFGLDLIGMPTRTFMAIEIRFSDLTYLPLGVLLITYFTNKRIPFARLLMAYVALTPMLSIVMEVVNNFYRGYSVDFTEHLLAYVYYALGLILLAIGHYRKEQKDNTLPAFAVWLGSISYSVYLIHLIVIYLVSYLPASAPTGFAFILRVGLLLGATIGISYLLEKKIQPRIVSLLNRMLSASRRPQYELEQTMVTNDKVTK